MEAVLRDFADAIDLAVPRLMAYTAEESAARRRGLDTWSRREILGHLIDSAANNHHRFVRARRGTALTFPGYEQDLWVRAQDYQAADWRNLVALWESYNRHLLHVMSVTPPEACAVTCTIGAGEPVTLEFIMTDYVRHLRHHLGQIFGEEV